MKRNCMAVFATFILVLIAGQAQAAKADRVAVEATVRKELAKDLASPWNPGDALSGRSGLDGRPVKDFPGEVVEFWANVECPYCGISEPLLAQQQNADVLIVVRHVPSKEYGESLKKALSYEALKTFSANAANRFWDAVVPKNNLPLPVSYQGALLAAFQEAAIAPEAFTEAVEKQATAIVNTDVLAAQGRITSTPTWVLSGIRFPACDFTAAQLPEALELARKARAGDEEAKERIVIIIVNGLLNETLL
jgi:hypothetical protein